MNKLEKELKYYLCENDYYKFIEYLRINNIKNIQVINQINYYIDTKELKFFQNDITVRIRRLLNNDEKYELTIKEPVYIQKKDNLKVKKEVNIELEKVMAEDILKNQNFTVHKKMLMDIFNELNIQVEIESLIITGDLSTERQFYLINKKLEPINIDISSYLGVKDYEIEWELDEIEEAKDIIESILNSLKISYKNKVSSKNKRFYGVYLKK